MFNLKHLPKKLYFDNSGSQPEFLSKMSILFDCLGRNNGFLHNKYILDLVCILYIY